MQAICISGKLCITLYVTRRSISASCALYTGRVIKDFPRDKVKITSKWGAKFTAQGLTKDMSMAACREQCEGSLQRLGVDYLDMYIYRGPPKDDHGTTIEQCVENMKVSIPLLCDVLTLS